MCFCNVLNVHFLTCGYIVSNIYENMVSVGITQIKIGSWTWHIFVSCPGLESRANDSVATFSLRVSLLMVWSHSSYYALACFTDEKWILYLYHQVSKLFTLSGGGLLLRGSALSLLLLRIHFHLFYQLMGWYDKPLKLSGNFLWGGLLY